MPLKKEIEWLLNEKYDGKETPSFKHDLTRLRNGEHIDYVIGFSNFLDVKVDLSKHPLIPRPETEHWVEQILPLLRTTYDVPRTHILDLFCGSGCIGLAVLKHVSAARVDFADIERNYFAGIKKSLKWNVLNSKRARFLFSDAFQNIKGSYDVILANPPYIPSAGRRVQKSVLAQEPHAALFAGRDGLKFIRVLLRGAKENITSGGLLIFEFDPPQKNKIAALAKKFGWKIEFHKDQYGRYRWCAARPKTPPESGGFGLAWKSLA